MGGACFSKVDVGCCTTWPVLVIPGLRRKDQEDRESGGGLRSLGAALGKDLSCFQEVVVMSEPALEGSLESHFKL